MLPGVKLAHLRTLLGFIYTGEVKVSEDELPDLLEVAEMLGVRGLKANKDDEDDEEEKDGKEEAQPNKDGNSKNTSQEEDSTEKETEGVKNLDSSSTPKPQTPEPLLCKTEPNLLPDPPKTPMAIEEEEETGPELEEEKEQPAEEPLPVKAEPTISSSAAAAATPKPSYPGLQSQYGYMAPYMSPLVSMSNLAAMYQQVCL